MGCVHSPGCRRQLRPRELRPTDTCPTIGHHTATAAVCRAPAAFGNPTAPISVGLVEGHPARVDGRGGARIVGRSQVGGSGGSRCATYRPAGVAGQYRCFCPPGGRPAPASLIRIARPPALFDVTTWRDGGPREGVAGILVPCVGSSDFVAPGRDTAAGSSTCADSTGSPQARPGEFPSFAEPATLSETFSCRMPAI